MIFVDWFSKDLVGRMIEYIMLSQDNIIAHNNHFS